MRHVVVLNQYALPRTEGGGTRHIDLFSRTADWDPLIVTGNRNHYSQERFRTADRRFRTVPVPPQSGGAVSRLSGWIAYAIAAFAVTLCRRDLQLVYGSSPQPLAPLVGLAAARLRRVPFVLEVRDLWPESAVAAGKLKQSGLVNKTFQQLERFLARQASFVVCVTEGWEEHFSDLGVDAARLVVVPNGTEPSDFTVEASREALRERHSIRGFTAVFAGSHGPKDGIDLVLDAAAALTKVNFLLVGAGPVKAAAIDRVHREGLSNVDFRAPVAKQDLPGLLTACDAGIHAVSNLSVFEKGMSPNKLFDYMAAGLPIASNAENALRRIVIDGDCGRIGGSSSLALCLQAIADAPATQRRAWSLRSQELLRDRFSRAASADALNCVLNRSWLRSAPRSSNAPKVAP